MNLQRRIQLQNRNRSPNQNLNLNQNLSQNLNQNLSLNPNQNLSLNPNPSQNRNQNLSPSQNQSPNPSRNRSQNPSQAHLVGPRQQSSLRNRRLEAKPQTDAIIGWVDKAGRPFMMDTWIVGQTSPRLDASQDVTNIKGKIVDGVTTLSFDRKRDTGDTEQDMLSQNSAWKDYSTANTNYAFEPYEADEKQPHSLDHSNGSSRSTMPLHKPMVAYHHGNGSGSQYADTRSLQRPKGYHHPVERSTYSLPRTQAQVPPPQ
ncbi:unnamed protein product, partial [Nesidiocoris tenuis]